MSGWKGEEPHTQEQFDMKNKLRYSLCCVVLGGATVNEWQFFFCRGVSVIHFEQKIILSCLNKGLQFSSHLSSASLVKRHLFNAKVKLGH